MHPELAPEAGLLEAAERRRYAHRRVRVDAEDAGLERPCDPQRPRSVARPDRAREPVRRVVRDPDRVGLVVERDDRRDRAEHLVARHAVVVRRFDERAREPEARALRGFAAEERRSLVDERRHRLAMRGRDQRPHLGRLVRRDRRP